MEDSVKKQIYEAIQARIASGLDYQKIEEEFIQAGYAKEQIQELYYQVVNSKDQSNSPVISHQAISEEAHKPKNKLKQFLKYIAICFGVLFLVVILLGLLGKRDALVASYMDDIRSELPVYLEKNNGKLSGFCGEESIEVALSKIEKNTKGFACEATDNSILIQYILDGKKVVCSSAIAVSPNTGKSAPSVIACMTLPNDMNGIQLTADRPEEGSIFKPALGNGKADWSKLQAMQFPDDVLNTKPSISGDKELKYVVLENNRTSIGIPDMYGSYFGFSSGRYPDSLFMVDGGVDPCAPENVDTFVSSSGQSACYDMSRYPVMKLLPDQFKDSKMYEDVDKTINAVHQNQALFLYTDKTRGHGESVQKVYLGDKMLFELPTKQGEIIGLFSVSDKPGWAVQDWSSQHFEIYFDKEKISLPSGVNGSGVVLGDFDSGFENGRGYINLSAKQVGSTLTYVLTFVDGNTALHGPFSRGTGAFKISESGVSFFGRDAQVTKVYVDGSLSEEIVGSIDWGIFSESNEFIYSLAYEVHSDDSIFTIPANAQTGTYKPYYGNGKLYLAGTQTDLFYLDGEWFDFSSDHVSFLYVVDGYPLVLSDIKREDGYVRVAYFLDGSPWQEDLVRSINILNSLYKTKNQTSVTNPIDRENKPNISPVSLNISDSAETSTVASDDVFMQDSVDSAKQRLLAPAQTQIADFNLDEDAYPRDMLYPDGGSGNNITLEEVSSHNIRNDCWVVYANGIHDISSLFTLEDIFPAIRSLGEKCGTDIHAYIQSQPVEAGSLNTARFAYAINNFWTGDWVAR